MDAFCKLVFLSLATTGATLHAQVTSGNITGQVVDRMQLGLKLYW